MPLDKNNRFHDTVEIKDPVCELFTFAYVYI